MLEIGQVIGSYRITRKLGEGGMGEVFEAVHDQIGRRAAIKILHRQYASEPQLAQRFLNEARAVNLIDHPGVVEVFDLDRLADGTTYIVMEFLRGETLTRRLERRGGRLKLNETLHLIRQIASALAAAHDAEIVHRDLKPDNVMIIRDLGHGSGERAKILDFGIAKLGGQSIAVLEADRHAAQKLTKTGTVMGTALYMAPEQCMGAGRVDGKADVYSLGVILFELLTGRPPFQAEGFGAMMAMHIYEVPPALDSLVRDLPKDAAAELTVLCARLLAKDPAHRPSMAELLFDTEQLAASRPFVRSAISQPDEVGSGPLRFHPSTIRGSSPSVMVGQRGQTAVASKGSSRWRLGVGMAALLVCGNLGVWLSMTQLRVPNPAPSAALGEAPPSTVAPSVARSEATANAPAKGTPAPAQSFLKSDAAAPSRSPATGAATSSPAPASTTPSRSVVLKEGQRGLGRSKPPRSRAKTARATGASAERVAPDAIPDAPTFE